MPRRSATVASESEDNGSEGNSDGAAPEESDNNDDEEGPGQEIMDLEDYHSIRAMADADHAQVVAKNLGPDSTADIRTVFTRMKGQKDPKTGKLEDGSECKICVGNGREKTFLIGSVTTLRYHIARNKGHYEVYKARCVFRFTRSNSFERRTEPS
ncbi:hypothetical protein B0H19DRAFT_1231887 [Mycena capillaripes]|nr:hypothetical protein B0H19DRAFT_1231887 [Mycena capillaripes]